MTEEKTAQPQKPSKFKKVYRRLREFLPILQAIAIIVNAIL